MIVTLVGVVTLVGSPADTYFASWSLCMEYFLGAKPPEVNRVGRHLEWGPCPFTSSTMNWAMFKGLQDAFKQCLLCAEDFV